MSALLEFQQDLRLWWVAEYHDGSSLYESERPGEVSSEDVDRINLRRFSLVDEDGTVRHSLDFPEGDDPKLIYRRSSDRMAPNTAFDEDEHPEFLTWRWSYKVGRYFRDGTLELDVMRADGSFVRDPDATVKGPGSEGDASIELALCEVF